MSLRFHHHLFAAFLTLCWLAGLLSLMVVLHQRVSPPEKKLKRTITPNFATIRKPPPPAPREVEFSSGGGGGGAPGAPSSLLPALKLPSPVPLPYVASTQTGWGQGFMHPGGSGSGGGGGSGLGGGGQSGGGGRGGKSKRTLILTEALVDKPPRLILRVPPTYPAHAETQNIEGEVHARLLVGVHGRVERVEVLKARPSGVFESAARQAMRKWRFKPGQFRGRPVRTWMRQRLVFQLR